jgi:hypothetical protein
MGTGEFRFATKGTETEKYQKNPGVHLSKLKAINVNKSNKKLFFIDLNQNSWNKIISTK